jgi:hypothetical protein
MTGPRLAPSPPNDTEIEEENTPGRRRPYDPNDLDEIREAWEDRGYTPPSPGGWIGPDD